jgi:hypothetical protein
MDNAMREGRENQTSISGKNDARRFRLSVRAVQRLMANYRLISRKKDSRKLRLNGASSPLASLRM